MLAPLCCGAQSLFDEMIINGETVNTDTVAPAPATAAPAHSVSASSTRARRAQRASMRRRNAVPSLWDLTDADGNQLNPEDFGPQPLVPDSTLVVDDLVMGELSFMPLIFSGYSVGLPAQSVNPVDPASAVPAEMNWAERAVYRDTRNNVFAQDFMIAHPELVRYNIESMPRPPKEFRMEVDP